MSFTPTFTRRLLTELSSLVGREVEVILINGKKYRGRLIGFDHPSMDLMLANATSGDEKIARLFIKGAALAEIRAYEESIFNPQEFATYLVRKLGLRPDAVKVYQDAGVVVVLNTYRVTATGVEGAGAMAGKIYGLLKEYLEAKKRGEQPQ